MKKQIKKPLHLSRETIKTLEDRALTDVAGGATVREGCTGTNNTCILRACQLQ
jgi:hypothetical protein